MTKEKIKCPNDQREMQIKKLEKGIKFRGIDIVFPAEYYVCPICGVEAGSVEQTAKIQRAISDAYRKAVNLLTGEEIREQRKGLSLSQDALAKRMNVGVASIKRWEGGLIQSKSMDTILRIALQDIPGKDNYLGNRSFSISRIKLVLKEFESKLGRVLLKKNDKMLFAAKYLWYADMVAYRDLGMSMTGSTYAKLPFGPQLNNYRDLIDVITKANERSAEPLTEDEKRSITRISRKFPEEKMVYEATHKEIIVKSKSNGEIIPYSDSINLMEL